MAATRHHTTPRPTPRPARALTAAARRIDITNRAGRRQLRKTDRWQSEAWAYYDALSLVGFSINFFGNSVSRLRVFPSVILEHDEAPISLVDAAGNDTSLARLAEDASNELARIDNDTGGFPTVLRGLAQNIACVGECYLLAEPAADDDELRDENWTACSVDAIKVRGDKTYLLDDEHDRRGRLLADDTLVYRIWRPHPRWPRMPHSNMRSVLADCEELLIYSRTFRAIAKSRAHAGGLTWPAELSLNGGRRENPDSSGAPAGGDPDDVTGAPQALEDLADAMTTAIEDDDSVAQVAPTLLEGAYDYLDGIRLLSLARDIDPRSLERVGQLVENFAHGVDLPTEIVTGKAASNHWTAWAIDDDTYKAHVEPLAAAIVGGICNAVIQPALLELGHDPALVARVRLGLDPAALTTRPNRTQDAKDLWDRWAISNDALRRYADFPESDAPTDEEVLRRLALNRGIGSVGLTGLLLEQVGLIDEIDEARLLRTGRDVQDQPAEDNPSGDQGRGEEGGDPVPEAPQIAAAARALTPGPRRPVVAADDGTAAVLAGVAAAFAAIETRVRDRLVIAASAAVTDALRVAGQRLRRAVQGDPSLRDRVNGIPANEVGLVLGPAALDAVDADTLLDGAFVTLGEQWDTWVAAAQSDIARQLERLPAGPVAAGAVIAGYTGPAEQDRAAGWAVLAAAVASLTRERLFAAGPSIVDGEHDPSTLVPAGMVRDALAQTGGSTAGLLPSGPASRSGPGGLTTGPRVLAVIGQLNVRVAGWRWTVGMPAYPFEPHQRLAGAVFDSWDAPVLANPGAWPPVPFFSPGDHVGCQCDAVMQLVALPGAMETRADAA